MEKVALFIASGTGMGADAAAYWLKDEKSGLQSRRWGAHVMIKTIKQQ